MNLALLKWWVKKVPQNLTGTVTIEYRDGQVMKAECRDVANFPPLGASINVEDLLQHLDMPVGVPVEIRRNGKKSP